MEAKSSTILPLSPLLSPSLTDSPYIYSYTRSSSSSTEEVWLCHRRRMSTNEIFIGIIHDDLTMHHDDTISDGSAVFVVPPSNQWNLTELKWLYVKLHIRELKASHNKLVVVRSCRTNPIVLSYEVW